MAATFYTTITAPQTECGEDTGNKYELETMRYRGNIHIRFTDTREPHTATCLKLTHKQATDIATGLMEMQGRVQRQMKAS